MPKTSVLAERLIYIVGYFCPLRLYAWRRDNSAVLIHNATWGYIIFLCPGSTLISPTLCSWVDPAMGQHSPEMIAHRRGRERGMIWCETWGVTTRTESSGWSSFKPFFLSCSSFRFRVVGAKRRPARNSLAPPPPFVWFKGKKKNIGRKRVIWDDKTGGRAAATTAVPSSLANMKSIENGSRELRHAERTPTAAAQDIGKGRLQRMGFSTQHDCMSESRELGHRWTTLRSGRLIDIVMVIGARLCFSFPDFSRFFLDSFSDSGARFVSVRARLPVCAWVRLLNG